MLKVITNDNVLWNESFSFNQLNALTFTWQINWFLLKDWLNILIIRYIILHLLHILKFGPLLLLFTDLILIHYFNFTNSYQAWLSILNFKFTQFFNKNFRLMKAFGILIHNFFYHLNNFFFIQNHRFFFTK